jgi:hypothetical protein
MWDELKKLAAGTMIRVHYWDHAAASEEEKAKPAHLCCMGYFVKADVDESNNRHLVLAMDTDFTDRFHPFSTIIFREVIKIEFLDVVGELHEHSITEKSKENNTRPNDKAIC